MRLVGLVLLTMGCTKQTATDTQSGLDTETDTQADADTDADTDAADTDADTDTPSQNGTYTGSFSAVVVAISDSSLSDTCSGEISLVYNDALTNNEVSGTAACAWTGLLSGSIEGSATVYGRSNPDGSLTGSLMLGSNLPATWTGSWTTPSALEATASGTFSASTSSGSLPMSYTISWTATR